MVALFAMCAVSIIQIRDGRGSSKDLTTLITYMIQLHATLQSLGTSAQEFLKAVVNSERLIRIMVQESKAAITRYGRGQACVNGTVGTGVSVHPCDQGRVGAGGLWP